MNFDSVCVECMSIDKALATAVPFSDGDVFWWMHDTPDMQCKRKYIVKGEWMYPVKENE